MKIVVATGGNVPSKYAHSFSVMKMAQGFLELGHDVEVIAPLSLPIFIQKINLNVHDFYGIDEQVRIKFVPIFSFKALFNTYGFSQFDNSVSTYCKKKNVDLVYCRSYLIPYYCVKNGVPAIIETHTTNYEHPDLQKIYESSRDHNFKGLITISDIIKKEHITRGVPEEKILILDDGVDLKRFEINDDRYFWRKKLGLPLNKKLVVYCGHLYEEKGIEHILLTARRLMNKNILFVLVGGWKEDIFKWENYCKVNQIKNTAFRGFVNNSVVPQYLKAADVLIMPYKTDMNFRAMDIQTTSPLKLFEYMASNRPIVSTDIPVISKIVKHQKSALLAEPNNLKQLAGYILELLKNKDKAEKVSINAYAHVKQFEWKERCRKIIFNIT